MKAYINEWLYQGKEVIFFTARLVLIERET